MCDISQAFLQSTTLLDEEKFIAFHPPRIVITAPILDGAILEQPSAQALNQRYGFLCHKPLYGSSDAPSRWYLAIAAVLCKHHYLPHRADIFLCSRRKPHSNIGISTILIHVGDLLMTGTRAELGKFKCLVAEFEHGPVEECTPLNPLCISA